MKSPCNMNITICTNESPVPLIGFPMGRSKNHRKSWWKDNFIWHIASLQYLKSDLCQSKSYDIEVGIGYNGEKFKKNLLKTRGSKI